MLKRKFPALAAFAASASIAAVMSTGAVADNMFSGHAKPNSFWWPNQVDLGPLRDHDAQSKPYVDNFDYAKAFASVDMVALKADIEATLKDSQDWWPADWGHYGGLMIRMAWHAAGTYRIHDGRGGADGGQQRFEPLGSWPDNANLDKARRLLWPVKEKYGRNVSWADLIILAGNVSLESMGFKTLGFAGGRVDDWEADLVYWGPETEWLGNDKRFDKDGKLEKPLAALHMGLIYVNPEGRNGNMDPKMAAEDIRKSFYRMAMNDEEIVALIAGGHTLGKMHGASKASCVGTDPAGSPVEQQGLGWKNECGKGHSEDTMTSGLEGAWTQTPTSWSILYLDNLFRHDWKKQRSPGGGEVWIPTDTAAHQTVPDAHIEGKRNSPVMLTTDLALKEDPGFRAIAERFWKNPAEFDMAFAKAWFKLTHRDMGPKARYVGSEVPAETFIWQDPVPAGKEISTPQAKKLKAAILESGLSVPELVRTAWASASTYRYTDMRGGSNGARIQLAPQKDWAANDPKELAKVLRTLQKIKDASNSDVSMADLIVLGGAAAIEKAAKDAGHQVDVDVKSGRGDATQKMTDVESFAVLEPKADGFRNFYSDGAYYKPAEMLVEKADLLGLTVPEMTALVGGLRVLDANAGGSKNGVMTDKPGQLSNDFFVNLVDMSTSWQAKSDNLYEGRDRSSGELKWTATTVDLVFGSNSELRAVAEAYASTGGEELFMKDFVRAWNKVMNSGTF